MKSSQPFVSVVVPRALSALGPVVLMGINLFVMVSQDRSFAGPRDPAVTRFQELMLQANEDRFDDALDHSVNDPEHAPVEDLASQGHSAPDPSVFRMLVFGDSLGASTFAGTTIGQQLRSQDIWRLLSAMSLRYLSPKRDDRYRNRVKQIVAYEDFNAFSGSQSWSHRSRLEHHLRGKVQHENYAVPGARTDGLEEQVTRFSQDYGYSPLAPAYIAISIGGNDFCDAFAVESAVSRLYASIRRLRSVLPQSLVLISGVPDVVDVFRDYDRVAFRLGQRVFTCKQRVQSFPMCARERALISGDEQLIANAKQELVRYQRSFAELAQRIETAFPEEGPVRYAPLPNLWDAQELLAADCFHPGAAGHESIADATWQAVEDVFGF